MANSKTGMIFVKRNGSLLKAVGAFRYNLGLPKKEGLVGHDGFHGSKEIPQIGYIEGEIRDDSDLSLEDIQTIEDETVTIELNNGKVISAKNAFYASEGEVETEEGKIPFRVESEDVQEIK